MSNEICTIERTGIRTSRKTHFALSLILFYYVFPLYFPNPPAEQRFDGPLESVHVGNGVYGGANGKARDIRTRFPGLGWAGLNGVVEEFWCGQQSPLCASGWDSNVTWGFGTSKLTWHGEKKTIYHHVPMATFVHFLGAFGAHSLSRSLWRCMYIYLGTQADKLLHHLARTKPEASSMGSGTLKSSTSICQTPHCSGLTQVRLRGRACLDFRAEDSRGRGPLYLRSHSCSTRRKAFRMGWPLRNDGP